MFSKSVFVLILCCYVFGKTTQQCPTEALEKVIQDMKDLADKAAEELSIMQNTTLLFEDNNNQEGILLKDPDPPECTPARKHFPENCAAIQEMCLRKEPLKSGVQWIQPKFWSYPFQVYCDFTTDGGGWTLIQRRDNYSVQQNFNTHWLDYKHGFGSIEGVFWLGNDRIYALTLNEEIALRIDMEDFDGNVLLAQYSQFRIEGPSQKFKLHVKGYSGNAGNAMEDQNRMPFSTFDEDRDDEVNVNCADKMEGGWWYAKCPCTYLNGQYGPRYRTHGVAWNYTSQEGYKYKLKKAEMKIRPRNYRG